MSDSGDSGFAWLVAIGLGIWGWNTHTKLNEEREERIVAVQRTVRETDALELRVIELERKVEFAEGDIARAYKTQDKIIETFNKNVKMDNEAAVRRMTARGACGTEVVNFKDGGWTMRNKECTLKDLK